MGKKITKKEFSRQMGVSKGRVSQWLSMGVIQEDEEGKLDKERAVKNVWAYRNRRLSDSGLQAIDLKLDFKGLG